MATGGPPNPTNFSVLPPIKPEDTFYMIIQRYVIVFGLMVIFENINCFSKGDLVCHDYLFYFSVNFRLFDEFENQINTISQEVWRDMGLLEDSSSGEDEETGGEASGASASASSGSRALLPSYPHFIFLRRGDV